MVGGRDYNDARRSTSPRRASASRARRSSRSCSPTALRAGHRPGSRVAVAQAQIFSVAERPRRSSSVNNYEDHYSGVDARSRTRRRSPTTRSTPQVGLKVGHEEDRAGSRARMGIRTPVSRNYAMTLGGLQAGRHAARHGPRLRDVRDRRPARHRHARRDKARPGRDPRGRTGSARPAEPTIATQRAAPHARAAAERRRRPRSSILQTVVQRGTGKRARLVDGVRRRQDRHDRELRRRLVRRLHRRAARSPSGSATRTSSSR